MARPVVGLLAEEAYLGLAPFAFDDEALGWPLLAYLGALTLSDEEVAGYARDSVDGPGWSALLDIDRAPSKGLGWLAQFVGVRLEPGLDDASQRARIKATDGFKRGTPGALIAAARQYLTGLKKVQLIERDGGPYLLTVHTQTSETPDSAKVLAALNAQKPGGLVLTYSTVVSLP